MLLHVTGPELGPISPTMSQLHAAACVLFIIGTQTLDSGLTNSPRRPTLQWLDLPDRVTLKLCLLVCHWALYTRRGQAVTVTVTDTQVLYS